MQLLIVGRTQGRSASGRFDGVSVQTSHEKRNMANIKGNEQGGV